MVKNIKFDTFFKGALSWNHSLFQEWPKSSIKILNFRHRVENLYQIELAITQ